VKEEYESGEESSSDIEFNADIGPLLDYSFIDLLDDT
jgi:hypothetical protein